MLSPLNCKFINNRVQREVVIKQVFYPISMIRYIVVRMYSIKRVKHRLLFERVYEIDTYEKFNDTYYKLIDYYKTCTCKKPII